MTEEAATVPTFSHSVKISDTQKGIRIDVHVWANSSEAAVEQAFEMYMDAKHHAIGAGIAIAPVEVIAK